MDTSLDRPRGPLRAALVLSTVGPSGHPGDRASRRARSPIDAFILASLGEPVWSCLHRRPCDLVRRLYFDLLGVPPPMTRSSDL